MAIAYTIFRICDDDLSRRDTVLLFDTLVWRVVPNRYCPAVRHTCLTSRSEWILSGCSAHLSVRPFLTRCSEGILLGYSSNTAGGNSSDMGRGDSPVIERRTPDRNISGSSPGKSGGKFSSPWSIFCDFFFLSLFLLSCIRSTQQHTLTVERDIIPHSALLLRDIHYGQSNTYIIIITTRHSLRTK